MLLSRGKIYEPINNHSIIKCTSYQTMHDRTYKFSMSRIAQEIIVIWLTKMLITTSGVVFVSKDKKI